MKVKELIEELKKCDPEMECIWEGGPDDDNYPLASVRLEKYGEEDAYDGKGIFSEEHIISHKDGYVALYFSPVVE